MIPRHHSDVVLPAPGTGGLDSALDCINESGFPKIKEVVQLHLSSQFSNCDLASKLAAAATVDRRIVGSDARQHVFVAAVRSGLENSEEIADEAVEPPAAG